MKQPLKTLPFVFILALLSSSLHAQQTTTVNINNKEEANLGRANLYGANLEGAKLGGANLYGANFEGANFEGANLEGAILNGSNLQEANLEGTINLTIDQLAMVKTLYKAKLDDELMKQVKEKYPHLLKDPKKELEDSKKE